MNVAGPPVEQYAVNLLSVSPGSVQDGLASGQHDFLAEPNYILFMCFDISLQG